MVQLNFASLSECPKHNTGPAMPHVLDGCSHFLGCFGKGRSLVDEIKMKVVRSRWELLLPESLRYIVKVNRIVDHWADEWGRCKLYQTMHLQVKLVDEIAMLPGF